MAAATPAAPTTTPATATPTDFFRREAVDFVACGYRGLRIGIGEPISVVSKWSRHQGRGLRARGERDAACGESKGEFQKVPAFHDISSHDISSLAFAVVRRGEFQRCKMNAR
jgi:hypothetical protein